MDPRIARLKSTTFCGQRYTRKQIARILDVVETFPLLSRSELALTVCEQLRLQTPSGNNRLSTALNTLAELQKLGLLTLPPPRKQGGRGPQKPIQPGPRTAPQPAVEGPLAALGPVRLALADGRGQVREWNAWVDRYHPLGYRQPIGAHLRYFVLDGQGRKLGCLLFDFAVRKVACRDEWIGWAGQKYRKHLKLVVRNARFLLFPWVGVKNLASHVLGLAARQVAADWQRQHRYRPVLLETYVDSERYAGTCYRAAGWQCVGKTQGRKAQGRNPAVTPKAVYVRPLHPRWQQALLQGPRALARKKSAARAPTPPPRAAERTAARERFLQMWARVLADVVRVTSEWDRAWMQRRRLLNTLLVVLFVFRLVLAPRNQGYAATATELWDQCRQLDIPLPQSQPVSPGALSRARAKIHPQAFLRVHRAVLEHAPRDDPRALWRGHRVFAVDGSKLNLPRPLLRDGYRLPSETAHYPQGLLSCLLPAARPPPGRLRPARPWRRAPRRPGPPRRPRPRRCHRLRPRLLLLPAAARPLRAPPARGLPPAAQRQRALPRVHARRPQRRARDGPAQRPGAAAVPAGRVAALPRAPRQVRHRRPQLHAGHHAAGPQALPRGARHHFDIFGSERLLRGEQVL